MYTRVPTQEILNHLNKVRKRRAEAKAKGITVDDHTAKRWDSIERTSKKRLAARGVAIPAEPKTPIDQLTERVKKLERATTPKTKAKTIDPEKYEETITYLLSAIDRLSVQVQILKKRLQSR